MSTAVQIAANRQNAQLSTGPVTDAGKAKSCNNALKTGLTGRTVLLPGDDAELYAAHVENHLQQYQPDTPEERELVQSIADCSWRLQRIPALEAGIYAIGRLECAELFAGQDEAVREQLVQAKIFLTYQRQLNNLSIQENRLRRHREQDIAKLKELQTERARQRCARLTVIARDFIAAIKAKQPFELNGFEFSPAEIEDRAWGLEPLRVLDWRDAQKHKHAA
jgi:hypothetical protein